MSLMFANKLVDVMPSSTDSSHYIRRLHLKKRLGQHILKDDTVLSAIVDACTLRPETIVLEIGAGIANLTEALARGAKKIIAVELDRQFEPFHARLKKKFPNVEFLYADILKIDIDHIESLRASPDLIITGNIPYSITSPLVMKILESRLAFRHMILMVQKEVAERLTAAPGSKSSSALTLKVHYFCQTELLRIIPGSVFYPRPRVDSALVRFIPRAELPYPPQKRIAFFQFLNAAFGQRRKTILNSLGHALKGSITKAHLKIELESAGIEPLSRPETIHLEQYQTLFEILKK